LLDEAGQLLSVEDMPALPEANGRIATNAPLLATSLARSHARIAFCEFVGARPTDAKVAAFAFGRARGVIEGCAGALGLPIVFLTPQTWKRMVEIPPRAENKDLARTRAIARWPAHADLFRRKCDVDRAEACLIALAGLKREARNV
jgi:crossover junction endodeoxyribonuclease RuvC